ncbi:MAG: glycosyl hydrolase family 28-related protein [Pseudomonadota bacterium]
MNDLDRYAAMRLLLPVPPLANAQTGTPDPDTIHGTGAAGVIAGLAGDDSLCGGSGNDTLDGGAGNDRLRGGFGEDVLLGGDGDDRLIAGRGDDLLSGGAGADRLYGGAGDDFLSGGAGDDLLVGGGGADIFAIGPGGGRDVIRDFASGEDLIAFEGVTADFDDLTIVADGGGAIVSLGAVAVRLRDVTPDQLTAADVLFPDAAPADPDAIVLPDGASVIDVADFGILPDDGVDDTAALQALLNSTERATYFFADGVYDFSDTVVIPDGRGTDVPSFVTLQGESEAGTVFKLADGLDHQGPIIGSEGNVAQAFNNRVRDLTFDIGTGNTQATGLQFAGNNQSTVKDVTIRSGEGGAVGLDLVNQSELGPALIEDVTVEGFETGITMAFQGNSVTLEDITLRDQAVGISSTGSHVAFLRGVDYEGPGTAIDNISVSRMVVLDSEFRASDPSVDGQVGVFSRWSLYAEELRGEGLDLLIDTSTDAFLGNWDIQADEIDQYLQFGGHERYRGGPFKLFEENSEIAPGLEVRETPETVWNADVGTWVDVRDFGAVNGQDASAAFQAAIDSGASTVYVPDGLWTLETEVVIRGAVEQVLASGEARLTDGAQLRIADGTSDQVVIEGLNNEGAFKDYDIAHDSGRTLVLRDITGFNYEAVADGDQGDVFLANVVGGQTIFRDQDVWARQLNLEGDSVAKGHEAKLVNDGADVWILGLKTEGQGTTVKTVNDGQTELLGAYHNGGFDADIPRFITEDAHLWATIVEGSTSSQDFDLVRETRDGVTREANLKVEGRRPDVYSAVDPAVLADRVIVVDNDAAALTGAWQDAGPAFPGNFLGSNFLFAEGGSDAAVTYGAEAQVAGDYVLSLRLIDDRGGQLHSGHSQSVDVEFGAGGDVFVFDDVDMRDVVDPWIDLGIVSVAEGEEMFVRFDADGVDGKIIADAVRFERVPEEDAVLA